MPADGTQVPEGELLSAAAISALSSAEVTSIFCLFSKQGEREGDSLHCDRSVA